MVRTCRRNTCHRPAVASLTFRYDTAEVRLGDLEAEAHPQRWDLCPAHAASLTVPRGWAVVDERSPEPVAAAELGRAPAGAASTARRPPLDAGQGQGPARPAHGGPGGRRGQGCAAGGRYAALQADLPRLAAELARSRRLAYDEDRGTGGWR